MALLDPSLVVAYTVQCRDPAHARDFLSVKPPANLKKPESVKAWYDDLDAQKLAWAQIDYTLPWVKLTGEPAEVLAVDIEREDLFDSRTFPEKSAGATFVQWLMTHYEFPSRHGQDYPLIVYGFNPKPLLRLAGQAAVRARMTVPLGLWYATAENHCLDPLQMILETEVKSLFPLAKVLAEAPSGPIPPPPESYAPHQDVETDLRLAVELCVAYGLLPYSQDCHLRDMIATGVKHMPQREPAKEPEKAEKPAAKKKAKSK